MIVDYLMPAVVLLVSVLGWILSWMFFLRGKIADLRGEMIEKRDLGTVKDDLVREIRTLRESTMREIETLREGKIADVAELRSDVREIRQDVKTLLSR